MSPVSAGDPLLRSVLSASRRASGAGGRGRVAGGRLLEAGRDDRCRGDSRGIALRASAGRPRPWAHAALCDGASARRLWAGRAGHGVRGAADQGRRQPEPSGEPWGDGRLRTGGDPFALRSRSLAGDPRRGRDQRRTGVRERAPTPPRPTPGRRRRNAKAADRARDLADPARAAWRPASRVSKHALACFRTVRDRSASCGRGRLWRAAELEAAPRGRGRPCRIRRQSARTRSRSGPLWPGARRSAEARSRFVSPLRCRIRDDADRRLRRSSVRSAARDDRSDDRGARRRARRADPATRTPPGPCASRRCDREGPASPSGTRSRAGRGVAAEGGGARRLDQRPARRAGGRLRCRSSDARGGHACRTRRGRPRKPGRDPRRRGIRIRSRLRRAISTSRRWSRLSLSGSTSAPISTRPPRPRRGTCRRRIRWKAGPTPPRRTASSASSSR